MEIKLLSKLSRDYVEQLLSGIPFFKLVKQQDAWQFELLLQSSRVVTYSPGEIVLQRGDSDHWLFFLLKGRLAVYADDPLKGELINYVTPGEVFGDLAQLMGQPRTATIIAEPNAKESMVLATDASIFGDINSSRPITVQTKLAYYRNTVHNLRWKLEVYRSQHLQHPLANKHRQVRLYTGVKDTLEELKALYEQAQTLASLLLEWNSEFGALNIESAKEQNAYNV
ncbi:cyclic nucleotide-binding domain-containing protein [Cellvibrio sp.]|uniref:cyclic nucleotide-binding domain-containing protein n=1 Tax=Cellvibrio sp. TaxID=1965322 RepID=UPI0039647571